MKKFLPLITGLLIAFVIMTSLQIASDSMDISAGPATNREKKRGLFQSAYANRQEYHDMTGKSLVLKDLKAPIVILNFWATWCRPCLGEFPSLVEFDDLYPNNRVQIIGVNSDDLETGLRNINKTIKEYGLKFRNILPQYKNKKNSLFNDFKIDSIPATIVFYKGKVVEISSGSKNFMSEKFQDKIKKLLKN